MAPTWATPADDLYNHGADAMAAEQFDKAADFFTQLIKGYPTGAHVDEARISGGYAYLRAGKFDESVALLAPLISDPNKATYKGTALYFTALDQFSRAQKETDPSKAKSDFGTAISTLTALIDVCTKTPTADNKGFLEPAIYYRSLAEYSRDDYDAAEKDLLKVIQLFPSSLSIPDYYLRLGSVYMSETNNAVTGKQPAGTVEALADKTIAAFDNVSRDANALVQANDANMSKAEVLYMIAQLQPKNTAGYQKALEAYRLVRRRQDMIPLQQQRIDQLKRQMQAALQSNPNSFSNQSSLLIQREEGRLDELKDPKNPDPIILALIRMAECYIAMQGPENADNARTILHRLAKATLPAAQQQEVDFQILYSYVLGGQTQKADAALTEYLIKHGSDPNASSISYQIAAALYGRKDYAGALTSIQRSLRDFPSGKGKYSDDALVLEAQILTSMGRIAESKKIIDDFLAQNPGSPKAINLLMTRAQNEENDGDFPSALADYQKVKDNAATAPDLQAFGAAGYIKVLHTLKRQDEVIAEAQKFEAQYPTAKALPSVMLFAALAMSEKHDPGAIAALQAVAQKYPDDQEIGPFALFTVVSLYHADKNVPGMIQAANDLRKAYPEAYPFLFSAADMASEVSVKAKKFDDAVALYQPLASAPKPDIAATASNKIASIWYATAKEMHYQSLPVTGRPGGDRAEAEKRLTAAEQAYVNTLKNFPDQIEAVGDALEGLNNLAKLHRSWGLSKDADLEAYLAKITADLTSPDMAARVEMAKAGLVFLYKNGLPQYPAALERYKKALSTDPNLVLTRQETDQLGELALAAGDYPTATDVYTKLLDNAGPNDETARGYAYYGLGAAAFAQGDLAGAKTNFAKLKQTASGGLWHPHIMEANYGIARADEQSGTPADMDEAKAIYSALIQAQQAGYRLQAEGMLGYARILDKGGFGLQPATPGTKETALFYYQEPHTLYGPGTPEQSASGLYSAGQLYDKAGDKANAKTQYDTIISTYSASAPDWVTKAHAAE